MMFISFWINLNALSDNEIDEKLSSLSESGINEIITIANNDKWDMAAAVCEKLGLRMQSWKMVMINNDDRIISEHPDWFTVNRNGISSAENPPYVGYYRWLCPNNHEVQSYLLHEINKLCERKYNYAVHLDYIRYSDVILPIKCQRQYDIVQKEELTEYDFCYCDTCREKFHNQFDYDIMEIDDPQKDENWRKFRWDSISNLVSELKKKVHENGKKITAAVFPTPDIARKLVRQDWPTWGLDAYYPMIYHDFYEKPSAWIKEAYGECILETDSPIHAGIFLPAFKNDNLEKTIMGLINNGIDKMSFFNYKVASDEVFRIIKKSGVINAE